MQQPASTGCITIDGTTGRLTGIAAHMSCSCANEPPEHSRPDLVQKHNLRSQRLSPVVCPTFPSCCSIPSAIQTANLPLILLPSLDVPMKHPSLPHSMHKSWPSPCGHPKCPPLKPSADLPSKHWHDQGYTAAGHRAQPHSKSGCKPPR